MASQMEEDDNYEIVYPTAPEDELEMSFEDMPTVPKLTISRKSNGTSGREKTKGAGGLPSHAFSRNYYCQYCSFNTTKSKIHLFHLVDVHGVDYKIFSCDRCDYASRWKCKVIRHRKMIHKINEPKFEPEMHDGRGQSSAITKPGAPIRPKPDAAGVSQSHTIKHHPKPAVNTSAFPTNFQLEQDSPPNKSTELYFNGQEQKTPLFDQDEDYKKSVGSESASRRKRKPQQVRRVLGPEDSFNDSGCEAEIGSMPRHDSREVSPSFPLVMTDGMTEEDSQESTPTTAPMNVDTSVTSPALGNSPNHTNDDIKEDKPASPKLEDLFGSKSTSSSKLGGFLSGAWRKRLMPTEVKHVQNNDKPPIADDKVQGEITANKQSTPIFSRQSDNNSSIVGKHSNKKHSSDEHSAIEEQFVLMNLMKEQLVQEIMIDEELHYRCTECTFISKHRWKTTKHYKANHMSNKTYTCTMCAYSTMNRVDFYVHKAKHSTRGAHKCEECAYVSSSKTNLDRHMVNHRQDNPVKCLYCSFSSTGEAAIQRHMAEHHGQSDVPMHMKRTATNSDTEDNCSQDEGGLVTCEICGYMARNWSKMKEHMIRHSEGTPFNCIHCDARYKRPADLNRHLKIKHGTCLAEIGLDGPTLKDNVVSGTGVSGEDDSGSDERLPSLKRAHPGTSPYARGESEEEEDEPKRLCIDEGAPIDLQCKKCSYLAKWPSDLDRHMKVHTDEKRFSCPICFRSYKYHGDLNVHMRRYHGATNSGKKSSSTPQPLGGRTPPPNVQVISNEVIVNMSHAAIPNPMANYGLAPKAPMPSPKTTVDQSGPKTPQMPTLKPAPGSYNPPTTGSMHITPTANETPVKKIKKGELDPTTMVHVPGGEFKCLNCCYETNFKSHLDAHMRLHPQKPFQCLFCNYASYWRGDTKKHIEKNHPNELIGNTVNPYTLVEQAFDEAVRNSVNRNNPLPEIHNVKTKSATPTPQQAFATPELLVSGGPNMNTPVWPTGDDSMDPTDLLEDSDAETSGQSLSCPHCSYYTMSESRLNAHVSSHYNLKIFKCPSCGKRANWKWDIQKHMKKDHPDCVEEVICMNSDDAKSTLDEYLKLHPEQKGKPRDTNGASSTKSIRPFRCSICGRRSNWKCDIRKHYRQVHPASTDAHVILMTKEELIEAGEKEDDIELNYPESKHKPNQNMFKPFRCSICGKNSRWKWDVTKHIKMVHRGNTEAYVVEDENPDGPKDVITPDTSVNEDEISPRIVAPREPVKIAPVPSSNTKIGCYQCSVCSQFSEFMWVIRRHIRTVHPDMADARIVDLSGKDESMNDSRPYICSLCGKRSNWKWDVKKHILSVHRGTIGSILDELLNKETVIYADGKSMDVDTNAKEKIAEIHSQLKDPATDRKSQSRTATAPPPTSTANMNNSCYSSMPTMVAMQSVVAPTNKSASEPRSITPKNGAPKSSVLTRRSTDSLLKFKCGYCFFVSTNRNETVRHVRSNHPGKILRIQTLNKASRDEQTTYKAAHRASVVGGNSHWQCSQCEYSSHNKEDALMHIQSHDLYNAYQCAVCDYADDMEYTLHKHIKSKHNIDSVTDVLIHNIVFAPAQDETETPTGVTFTCHECEMKTAWRSAIVRHIKEKHHVPDNVTLQSMFTKSGVDESKEAGGGDAVRRYNCTQCPYKTDKVAMFNEHNYRHTKRNDGDEFKCPHCDYWVASSRVLHQHMRVHQVDGIDTDTPTEQITRNTGLQQCTDCPYKGKAKDLNHHRRLHKQRPGCVYKCALCPYWVSHGRLLQQHMKVHSPEYRQSNSPQTPNNNEPTAEELAAFKQQIIASQIEPVKLEGMHDDNSSDGRSSLDSLNWGVARKSNKCNKCPYSSTKLGHVKAHEALHGYRGEGLLKCKFCDYYCGNRSLMSQHVKVHSLQYQGDNEDEDIQHSKGLSQHDGSDRTASDDMTDIVAQAAGFAVKHDASTGDYTLADNSATLNKFCCEKCPYTSRIKSNFTKHCALHGNGQKFKCEFCDYAVSNREMIGAHVDLHKQPNRNLLASQNLVNLTKLPAIPADVALVQNAEMVDGLITDSHDHLYLHENQPDFIGHKTPSGEKIFRCDRCPYTNARKDHLQNHVKHHMVRSEHACGHCDFSTSKLYLLNNHQKLHFSGDANEMEVFSDQPEEEPEFIDLADLGTKVNMEASNELSSEEDNEMIDEPVPSPDMDPLEEGDLENEEEDETMWICQTCDRAFDTEAELQSHEKQHIA